MVTRIRWSGLPARQSSIRLGQYWIFFSLLDNAPVLPRTRRPHRQHFPVHASTGSASLLKRDAEHHSSAFAMLQAAVAASTPYQGKESWIILRITCEAGIHDRHSPSRSTILAGSACGYPGLFASSAAYHPGYAAGRQLDRPYVYALPPRLRTHSSAAGRSCPPTAAAAGAISLTWRRPETRG
jgi:hypothetical protein